jgi:hypothetical protein
LWLLAFKKAEGRSSQTGELVDATEGRKTRSLIITVSGHLILSVLAPSTLAQKLGLKLKKTEEQNDEKR